MGFDSSHNNREPPHSFVHGYTKGWIDFPKKHSEFGVLLTDCLSKQKVFMSPSTLIVPLLLFAAGLGFPLLVFDGENVLWMKNNQFRIPQARDEQVEHKQDRSMKGCSPKRVR